MFVQWTALELCLNFGKMRLTRKSDLLWLKKTVLVESDLGGRGMDYIGKTESHGIGGER